MKPYTDIEQSKKLAEILPIDSADGFYEAQLNPTTDKWEYILFTGNKWASEEVVIPCWSLAALLEIIPEVLVEKRIPDAWDCVSYAECQMTSANDFENLIDACVEVIYKLKEKDLI